MHRKIPADSANGLRPTRRTFLAVLLGVTAATLLPPTAPADGGAPPPTWILPLVGDRDATARIGGAYLRDHPQERDTAYLAARLRDALGNATDVHGDASVPLAAAEKMIQDEYRDARVVDVDGWILSISEARLYALAALLGLGGD